MVNRKAHWSVLPLPAWFDEAGGWQLCEREGKVGSRKHSTRMNRLTTHELLLVVDLHKVVKADGNRQFEFEVYTGEWLEKPAVP